MPKVKTEEASLWQHSEWSGNLTNIIREEINTVLWIVRDKGTYRSQKAIWSRQDNFPGNLVLSGGILHFS